MPEKFSISMPIGTAPSVPLRQSLLHELPKRLRRWLSSPTHVMFLDPTSHSPSPYIPWTTAQAALRQRLGEQILTLVYFDTERSDETQSIVEISERSSATVYGVTLPNASSVVGDAAVLEIFVELHQWLRSNRISTFIAGGNELDLDEGWADDGSNVSQAAGEPLVEWLSCAKSRLLPHLDAFQIVLELGDVVICRRAAKG